MIMFERLLKKNVYLEFKIVTPSANPLMMNFTNKCLLLSIWYVFIDIIILFVIINKHVNTLVEN